jgi:hypothetical protein
MKWFSIAEQLYISLRSPCTMLAIIESWSSGNLLSGEMNLMDESGFGGCQENATCPNA